MNKYKIRRLEWILVKLRELVLYFSLSFLLKEEKNIGEFSHSNKALKKI